MTNKTTFLICVVQFNWLFFRCVALVYKYFDGVFLSLCSYCWLHMLLMVKFNEYIISFIAKIIIGFITWNMLHILMVTMPFLKNCFSFSLVEISSTYLWLNTVGLWRNKYFSEMSASSTIYNTICTNKRKRKKIDKNKNVKNKQFYFITIGQITNIKVVLFINFCYV